MGLGRSVCICLARTSRLCVLLGRSPLLYLVLEAMRLKNLRVIELSAFLGDRSIYQKNGSGKCQGQAPMKL